MDFERLKEFRNTRNPFVQKVGIVMEEVSLGYARAVKQIEVEDTNPNHSAHGGVCLTMADAVGGTAMASYGYATATVSASYSFLRKVEVGDTLTAVAKEIKHGGHLCVFDVEITNQRGERVGKGTFSFYRLEEKLSF